MQNIDKQSEKVTKILQMLESLLQPERNQLVKTLIGNQTEEVKPGNSIIANGRVISGDSDRLLTLLQLLESEGVSTGKYQIYVANNSRGYSPKIPDYGQRGEIVDLYSNAGTKKEPAQAPTIPKNSEQVGGKNVND